MLKKVTVEGKPYSVGSGIVGLTGEQAKVRLHNLKPVHVDKKTGAGEYEVVNPIQFKTGESFGYSGQVGKDGMLSDRDAEELRKMEQAETVEKAVALARQAALAEARKEYETKLAEARAEIEARVREELAAAAKK